MNVLSGKVALVTGTSAPAGIGRAIARRLASDGAAVVVTDIDRPAPDDPAGLGTLDHLQRLVRDIEDDGGRALVHALDVTSQVQIATCIDRVIAEFGRIDILVNNAGALDGADAFLSTTPPQWQHSFAVNLLGPMMMSQAVIPHMIAAGDGRIINIGSTGSLGAEPGFGAYTAMKHGLVGLSKTLAAEFGPAGIRCNTVCPGYIATDMHRAANQRLAAERGLSVDAIKAERYAGVALRDAGLPEDVANAVAFLAGPQAGYITGTNLPVTGGVPPGI